MEPTCFDTTSSFRELFDFSDSDWIILREFGRDRVAGKGTQSLPEVRKKKNNYNNVNNNDNDDNDFNKNDDNDNCKNSNNSNNSNDYNNRKN